MGLGSLQLSRAARTSSSSLPPPGVLTAPSHQAFFLLFLFSTTLGSASDQQLGASHYRLPSGVWVG